MKNLLGYLTCVAVAILLRVYINGSGGTLVLYLLAIAFVVSLAALLITKRKLVAAIKLSTEINAKNEEQAALQSELDSQKLTNAELQAIVDGAHSDEYIAETARDMLGYVTPGEKVFVDISSK